MLLESSTMSFIGEKFSDFLTYTGFANLMLENIIMIVVGAFFIWLAIKKDFDNLKNQHSKYDKNLKKAVDALRERLMEGEIPISDRCCAYQSDSVSS